jgi:lambda family phage portal protein
MGILSVIFGKKTAPKPEPVRGPRGRKRSYAAAAIDRLTGDWKFPETTADVETYQALKILRGRSRELFRNDDYMRRFANMLKTNVIGPDGIRMQAAAMDSGGNPDKGANRKIENAWWRWIRPENCSVSGTMSLWDIANQIIETCAQDGEVLVRLHNSWPGEFAFAVEVLEADHLDLTKNEILGNGNRIIMGVEIDRFRRPVAYWLSTSHPGDPYSMQSNTSERFPANDILHIYRPDRPGQTRAVPWVVTAMQRLKQLGAYEEAELIASRIAASKMGFFIPEDGSEYTGEEEDAETGDLVTSAEPGTFEQLPAKMQFQSWDPEHPVAAFEQFEKAVLRGIASGLNVSYVSLANNLEGVSYSSIRSGELADRDAWRMLQRWMIERFYTPVFERWLSMAIISGALQLPSGKYDKFREVRWKPRGWNWVDPAKESAAAVSDVKNGFKSLFDVAAERGYDLEEIMEENARARDLAKQYGLTLPVFNWEKPNGKAEPRTAPQAND